MSKDFGKGFSQLLKMSSGKLRAELECMVRDACINLLVFDDVQADCVAQALVNEWIAELELSAELPSSRKGSIRLANLDKDLLPKSINTRERLIGFGLTRWISEDEVRQVLNFIKRQQGTLPKQMISLLDIRGYDVVC